ncbi:MAG TPA: anti-sigma regulatory factor [Candidatus Dormibacteraeota bacterium]|nr:anti-sigma regulatory factor [Candidatus Dormibacteraeota bacterium]
MLASSAATEAITVHLETQGDVVVLRHRVREHALELGFSLLDQTKIVTAASELGRNAITYGGGGEAMIESLHDGRRIGIALTVTDHGPGIADVEQAMRPGFTTGSGLGYGLSGTKRLVDEFEIQSQVGVGTTVRIARWR